MFVWPRCASKFAPLCEVRLDAFSEKARRCGCKGSGGLSAPLGFHQHPHQVAFLHDQVLDAIELDFGPRPFSEEHPVAHLDVDGDELPDSSRPPGPTAMTSP